MATTLGLHTGLFDILMSHIPDSERNETIRRVRDIQFSSPALDSLISDIRKRKPNAKKNLEETVAKVLRDEKKQDAFILTKRYHDIKEYIPNHFLELYGNWILENLLTETDTSLEYKEGRMHLFFNSIGRSFTDIVDFYLMNDMSEHCSKPLLKRIAKGLLDVKEVEYAEEIYETIGDERGILNSLLRFNKVILEDEAFKREFHPEHRFASKLKRHIVEKRLKNKRILRQVIDLFEEDEVNCFKPKDLADILASDVEYFRESISRLADASLRSYKNGKPHMDAGLEAYKVLKQDERLFSFVLEFIEKDQHHQLDKLLETFPDLLTKERKQRMIAKTDEAVLKEARKKLGGYGRYIGQMAYQWAGLSKEEAQKRIDIRLVLAGKHDVAIGEHTSYRMTAKDYKDIFEIGIEVAKLGKLDQALKIFAKTKLEEVDINNDIFYETIAKSILSGYMVKPNLDPDAVKETINSEIKEGVIKALSVKSKENSLEIIINFGKHKVRYAQQKVKGQYRNEVSMLTQTGLSDRKSALKFYKDKESAEAEAFWLRFLEGKVPVKRLISSERFGNLYFNQIENSHGQRFDSVVRTNQDFKNAIDTAIKISHLITADEKEVRKAVRCELTDEYLAERFEQFYERLRQLNGTVDSRYILAELPKEQEEIIMDLEIEGIVPNDYTPRNLMIENGIIVPIDHEDYIEGHPITPIVMLVKNPENKLKRKQEQQLIQYAINEICWGEEAITTPDSVVRAVNLFYDVRRARTLAKDLLDGNADKNTLQHLNWYIRDMREVLGR